MINGTEFLRYQPGDGTSYDFVIVSDPYGGYLVVWPRNATYWVAKDASEYKFRHGNENKYTGRAALNAVDYCIKSELI